MANPGADAPPIDPRATAAVFLASAGLFAWTALPGVHWHDTAEFGAVGWRLGLSHPPGHPLHALLTQAAERLPLGDLGFRPNLLSALCLGAALAGLHRLLGRLSAGGHPVTLAAAALLPAVMPSLWLQGIRAEVYALQLLLGVGVALACHRLATTDDRRALPALALVFGLAGANHSLIGAAMLPLALVVLAARWPGWRAFGLACGAGALGLSTYLYLPLRARAGGEIGWGMPTDVGSLWETISGRAWQANLVAEPERVDLGENLGKLFVHSVDQVGLVASLVLLAAVVAGVVARRGRAPRPVLAALLVAACTFGTRFLYPFDPLNPDIGGYFAPAMLALVAGGWSLAPAAARWAFPAALALAAPNLDPGARMGSRVAEEVARVGIDEVPPDGALVYSDYAAHFLSWYLRAAEGTRPDATLLFRGQVGQGWAATRLATLHPERAVHLADFPVGFDGPDVRVEPGVLDERLGAVRARLGGSGVTLAVDGRGSVVDVARAWARIPPVRDVDSRRALGFLHAQHAVHHLWRGDRALAAWHVAEAEVLAPNDVWLAELRARLSR